MRTRVTVSIIAVSLFLGIAYKCEIDNSTWQQVEQSLVRLRSGIQYESIMQVRSKLADADSELALYNSTWHLLPPNHRHRVSDASKAISDVDLAMDWTSHNDQIVDAKVLQGFASDVVAFIRRDCSEGKLYANPSAVSAAFMYLGTAHLESAITNTDFQSKPPFPSTLDSQITDCREEELASIRQEEKRKADAQKNYWASFKYLVVVAVASANSCTLYVTTDSGVDDETIFRGHAEEYGTNKYMDVGPASCEGGVPLSDAITVKINGHPFKPNWKPHSAVIIQ